MEHGEYLKIRDNPEGYHVDGRWGDPRGPDEAATLGLVLGYVASQDVPWKHGVEYIKRLLKQNKLHVDPSCTNTIQSISQLHVKPPTRHGQQIREDTGDRNIQHKVDDHCADALRYLIGPLFVLGLGEHFADVYDHQGNAYNGSDAEDFFKLNSTVTLDGGSVVDDLLRVS
jgi:hypothetical protein